MRYHITPEWQISLDETFHHKVEENHLVFWRKGITVISTAFLIPENMNPTDLIARLKERPSTGVLDVFESDDGKLHRLGFMQTEPITDRQTRLALHTFTTAPAACLQTAFYLDDPGDISWVKETWESITFHEQKDN